MPYIKTKSVKVAIWLFFLYVRSKLVGCQWKLPKKFKVFELAIFHMPIHCPLLKLIYIILKISIQSQLEVYTKMSSAYNLVNCVKRNLSY